MSPMVTDYIAPLVAVDRSLKSFKNWRRRASNSSLGLKTIQHLSSERRGECLWCARCPWSTSGPQNGCFQGCRPAPLHSPLPIMQHPGCRIYMVISSSGPLETNRKHSSQGWATMLHKDEFKFILSFQFNLSFKNSYRETPYRCPVKCCRWSKPAWTTRIPLALR